MLRNRPLGGKILAQKIPSGRTNLSAEITLWANKSAPRNCPPTATARYALRIPRTRPRPFRPSVVRQSPSPSSTWPHLAKLHVALAAASPRDWAPPISPCGSRSFTPINQLHKGRGSVGGAPAWQSTTGGLRLRGPQGGVVVASGFVCLRAVGERVVAKLNSPKDTHKHNLGGNQHRLTYLSWGTQQVGQHGSVSVCHECQNQLANAAHKSPSYLGI